MVDKVKTRYCLIFRDRLVAITSPNSYKRETYVQIKGQYKLGDTWQKSSFEYYYFTNIHAQEKTAGEDTYFGGEGGGNSADVYYSLNFDYRMMMEGQTQHDYTDTYWYITRVSVSLKQPGLFDFEGIRETPTSGPFSYYLSPQDPKNVQWLTDF